MDAVWAVRHKNIPGFVDYHGTNAVWPKETFNIAQGLAGHGYHGLASQLSQRIIRAVTAAGEFYELFYVEDDGRVWFDHATEVEYFSHKSPGQHLSIPEPGQAWVVSAVTHILLAGKAKKTSSKPSSFEVAILSTVPKL